MSVVESKLLGLILSEWVRLSLDNFAQQAGEGHYAWQYRVAAIQDLDRLGVAIDPKWLGSDSAGRQARSRSLASLVSAGWITKRVVHRRLSFARPTEIAIRAIAEALAVPGVEPPEVEQTWLLEPKPLTSEEADLAATELETSIADTDDKLDALRAELNTGSEPRA